VNTHRSSPMFGAGREAEHAATKSFTRLTWEGLPSRATTHGHPVDARALNNAGGEFSSLPEIVLPFPTRACCRASAAASP
jgi:hypothetical protein